MRPEDAIDACAAQPGGLLPDLVLIICVGGFVLPSPGACPCARAEACAAGAGGRNKKKKKKSATFSPSFCSVARALLLKERSSVESDPCAYYRPTPDTLGRCPRSGQPNRDSPPSSPVYTPLFRDYRVRRVAWHGAAVITPAPDSPPPPAWHAAFRGRRGGGGAGGGVVGVSPWKETTANRGGKGKANSTLGSIKPFEGECRMNNGASPPPPPHHPEGRGGGRPPTIRCTHYVGVVSVCVWGLWGVCGRGVQRTRGRVESTTDGSA